MKPLVEFYKDIEQQLHNFSEGIHERRISPEPTLNEMKATVARFDFQKPLPSGEVIGDVVEMLDRWSLKSMHSRYFGFFNPSVIPIAGLADLVTAMYNPQLAIWSHSPVGYEIETHVLNFLMQKIGYDSTSSFAHFTNGGQESNTTAVIAAMIQKFPQWADEGDNGLPKQPVFYISDQTHHSFHKAAVGCGIGRRQIRAIASDDLHRMKIDKLEKTIQHDLVEGFEPFLVVGTGGTTGVGATDPLPELAEVAKKYDLWFHVDAAWAGSVLLSKKLRHHLAGIELADSVTWDAHKWLSVPLTCSMFFTRHEDSMKQAFGIHADYIPEPKDNLFDHLTTSVQWSRRLSGLRLFMALAHLGEDGLARLIEHQTEMGHVLRKRLNERGWKVCNESPFPIVNFTHDCMISGDVSAEEVSQSVNDAGQAWLSHMPLKGCGDVLRACITSYRTEENDLETLIDELEKALAPCCQSA